MSPWLANALGLALLLLVANAFAAAALWRVSGWGTRSAEGFALRHGIAAGARAPQIAGYDQDKEVHMGFIGGRTIVVFGKGDCDPCVELLYAGSNHPALSRARRVYLSAEPAPPAGLDPYVHTQWEFYRFHDEERTRLQWEAPVSPFFHFIDEDGRVLAKGIANRPSHLDRLLDIPPPGASRAVAIPRRGPFRDTPG